MIVAGKGGKECADDCDWNKHLRVDDTKRCVVPSDFRCRTKNREQEYICTVVKYAKQARHDKWDCDTQCPHELLTRNLYSYRAEQCYKNYKTDGEHDNVG